MDNKSPVPKKFRKSDTFGFVDAIAKIKDGAKVRRLEWTDEEEYCLLKDSFLMIHRKKEGTKETFHQWIVSEGDMTADDWVVVK